RAFARAPGAQRPATTRRVAGGRAGAEIAAIEAALPHQPLRVAMVLAGDHDLAGWWGDGRPAGWQDAIEAAREVLQVTRAPFQIEADQHPPWHPGRCAAIYVTGDGGAPVLAGHAGELHPRVLQAFKLPARVSAVQ